VTPYVVRPAPSFFFFAQSGPFRTTPPSPPHDRSQLVLKLAPQSGRPPLLPFFSEFSTVLHEFFRFPSIKGGPIPGVFRSPCFSLPPPTLSPPFSFFFFLSRAKWGFLCSNSSSPGLSPSLFVPGASQPQKVQPSVVNLFSPNLFPFFFQLIPPPGLCTKRIQVFSGQTF